MPPLRRLDTAGDAVRQVIRAYHGSPYDFDRFDASKIGAGEGHQSFGHGLYFGGVEETARVYRDALKDMVENPIPDELDSQIVDVIGSIRDLAAQRGKVTGADWWPLQKRLDESQDLLMQLQHRAREAAHNPGRIYEVEIGHPEDNLIDYDRGLGYQPPYVRERLARLNYVHPSLMRMAREDGPGRAVVNAFRDAYGPAGGAKILFDAGIPGVRYLDQGSRAAGEGTRNYVMFPGTEDSIRILRKFGMLAPIPAAAAMSGGTED